jgi:Ca2+/Na+ antiporter
MASPEVGVNITSAIRDASGIGLGAVLGSTVIGIPILVTVGYLATRKRNLPDDPGHDKHLRESIFCASIRRPWACRRRLTLGYSHCSHLWFS